MEVEYIKGLGCPVNIIWGKEARAITIKDAKQLQVKLAEVIEQAEREPELSEFEKKLSDVIRYAISSSVAEPKKLISEFVKEYAAELLDYARKEALKDLPRWRKDKSFETEGTFIGVKGRECFVVKDGYSISVAELIKKLPGFKED